MFSTTYIKQEPYTASLVFCFIESRVCLPAGWIPALPVLDQQWISKALFKWSRTGQPELDFTRVDRMWWYPPQPSIAPTGILPMERYFGHPVPLNAEEAVACAATLPS